MKRGAKRPALGTEPDLRSKRVMDTPSFNAHRAEPSHQPHLMAGSPPLDSKRAESSRQHVRALNTQFASWIQLQLQNHPDELWEDGVKDYLSHASHIMEKFKDVVEWLRANAAKSKSIGISIAGSTSRQNNFMASSEHKKPTLRTDINNGFVQVGTSASFPSLQNSDSLFNSQSSGSLFNSQSTGLFSSSQNSGSLFNSQSSGSLFSSQSTGLFSNSQSTGLFSNSQSTGLFSNSQSTGLFTSSPSSSLFSSIQTPAFPGNQTSTSPKVEASDVIDEENELEKPSSPSLKRTQEQGIVVVHEVKCKVYVKPDNPADKGWKDIGVGQLSIKCKEGVSKATKESKPTIVIRNDVGKILLNALIYPGIKMNIQKKTIASIFHTSGGSNGDGTAAGDGSLTMARAYLLRMKTEEETTKLAAAIEEYAPSA